MGRKYGRLAYGRYTYDLWPSVWIPIPDFGSVEIWVPKTPPAEVPWDPVPSFGSVEIWTPVTFPTLGRQ